MSCGQFTKLPIPRSFAVALFRATRRSVFARVPIVILGGGRGVLEVPVRHWPVTERQIAVRVIQRAVVLRIAALTGRVVLPTCVFAIPRCNCSGIAKITIVLAPAVANLRL